MKKILMASALLLSINAFAGDLPDAAMTPGATNPDVTQATINDTICKSGWTKTIRPNNAYFTRLKHYQMAQMKLEGNPSDYEEDHLISLELGGAPKDPKNLWPQKWYTDSGWGAHKKDVIETRLKRLVCTHQLTLEEAQKAVAEDWIAAYKKYVPAKK